MGTGLDQHQSGSICMTQIAESGFPQAIRQFDIGHQKVQGTCYLSCYRTSKQEAGADIEPRGAVILLIWYYIIHAYKWIYAFPPTARQMPNTAQLHRPNIQSTNSFLYT